MPESKKILMVCLGNICRSPLAEGILKSKSGREYIVDSAGTGNYHLGCVPDQRSIAVALKHGIDISSQQCRQFVKADFREFDLIFAMDRSNLHTILAMAGSDREAAKVKLLLQASLGEDKDVPDPYFGGEGGFEEVYTLLENACEALLLKLKTNGLGN